MPTPISRQIRGAEVSAHFVIRRDGSLIQFVSCDDRAWHAGRSHYLGRDNCNDFSIGIELEGLEGHSFEAPQYETLSSVCAACAQHYPLQHIAGHEHIAPERKQDPGAGFDWKLFQQSLGWRDEQFPPKN
jgi:AmpD protein